MQYWFVSTNYCVVRQVWLQFKRDLIVLATESARVPNRVRLCCQTKPFVLPIEILCDLIIESGGYGGRTNELIELKKFMEDFYEKSGS